MENEGLVLSAKANVKLTKLDENGKVLEVSEHQVDLTREEAKELWQLQQQE